MRPENPSDWNFFRQQVRLYDPCTRKSVSSSKNLAHYAKNEHFPPPILRSLLSAAPCDIVARHGRGKKSLGPRSNFAQTQGQKEQSTANSNSFKIAKKKNTFEAKGRLFTTGEVIQRLFIIDIHTQLAIYGYR